MLLRPLHHYRRCLVILVVIPLTWSFLLIGGTDNNYNHKVAMSLSASATSANSDDNSSNQRDDANESSAQDCKETSVEESTNEGAVPLLEAPDPNESLPTFKLGETIRLEEMGPIIINTDGKHNICWSAWSVDAVFLSVVILLVTHFVLFSRTLVFLLPRWLL